VRERERRKSEPSVGGTGRECISTMGAVCTTAPIKCCIRSGAADAMGRATPNGLDLKMYKLGACMFARTEKKLQGSVGPWHEKGYTSQINPGDDAPTSAMCVKLTDPTNPICLSDVATEGGEEIVVLAFGSYT